MIVFLYKWLKKWRFSHPNARGDLAAQLGSGLLADPERSDVLGLLGLLLLKFLARRQHLLRRILVQQSLSDSNWVVAPF